MPPSAVKSESKKTFDLLMMTFFLVLLVVLLSAGYVYFSGQKPQATAGALLMVERQPNRVTATPVPSGNDLETIVSDINSTKLDSFDADFADLQKDTNGL